MSNSSKLTKKITNIAFYKFVSLSNLNLLRTECEVFCKAHEIRGTLLLAKEGFNAILAGKDESITAFLEFFRSKPNCLEFDCKFSYSDFIPFQKLKILIKKEIITMKIPGLDPEHSTGIHLSPLEWNSLLSEEDVLVIDTRNEYEIEFGTFKNAINPNTQQFSEFPEFAKKHLFAKEHLNEHPPKKIAMFCTGGIRCEKASAYLMQAGFKEVYQLQGGILNYLNQIPKEQSLWEGDCFVFDERVTLSL